MDQIPAGLFADIHRTMPIVCVDVVTYSDNKILMIKRNREPAKNQFWFPGGRLKKGERLKDAAHRIVKGETGLSLRNLILVDTGETRFEADPFGHDQGTHTINFVFVARVSCMGIMALVLDDNHSNAVFYDLDTICNPVNNFHLYLRRFSIMADAIIN